MLGVLCMVIASAAGAIVSERHLHGINALECDLAPGANAPVVAFRPPGARKG
jgi:hypothetical protein